MSPACRVSDVPAIVCAATVSSRSWLRELSLRERVGAEAGG